jgi:molecular chaperone GrpE
MEMSKDDNGKQEIAEEMKGKIDPKRAEKKIKELEKDLKEARDTEELYLDQLKRLKAEFDNYRKRVEKQSGESLKNGERNLAKDLLVILDNLQRATDYEEIDFNGLVLIKKEFFNILSSKGLKLVETEGKKFDHNYHHAVGYSAADDIEEDTVIEVVQPGYLWNNELLRAAMVIIAKKSEKEEKKDTEEPQEAELESAD